MRARCFACARILLSAFVLPAVVSAQVILRDTVHVDLSVPDFPCPPGFFATMVITVEPETVAVGQEATITVIAVDHCGNEYPFEPDFLLEIRSVSVDGHGTTVISRGDTSYDSILFVRYRDARGGSIRIIPQGAGSFGTNFSRFFVFADVISEVYFTAFVPREPELDHFLVAASPERINHDQVATLSVIAADAQGNEIPLDAETALTFRVNNPEYGSFIGPDDQVHAELVNVSYADARSGRIRFVANGTFPIFPTTFGIHVSGLGKTGSGNLTILPVPVRLTLAVEPAEVYPAGTGGNSTATVRIRATRNDQPVEGAILQLEVKAVDGSGGHDHVEGRPTGRVSSFVGETDAEGVFVTAYTASAFGGIEKIIARIPSNPSEDSVEILARVPDLELLPEVSSEFLKIGGTPQHLGPPLSSEDNNHWGNPLVIRWLPEIARIYNEWLRPNSVIRYNDISLPMGGLIDISANWQPPHRLHRLGKNVDVRTRPPHADGVPISIASDLERIIQQFDARAFVQIHNFGTSNQHFHIEFRSP